MSTPMPFSASAPPTPMMSQVGISFLDVKTQAEHVIHLLETQGANALEIVRGIIRMIAFFTARDMLGVFSELAAAHVNVQNLIQAVKDEFGL